MPEVLDLLLHEEALLRLQLDTGILQQRNHRVEMIQMLILVPREDDDVVQLYEARLPAHSRQDDVESTLKR